MRARCGRAWLEVAVDDAARVEVRERIDQLGRDESRAVEVARAEPFDVREEFAARRELKHQVEVVGVSVRGRRHVRLDRREPMRRREQMERAHPDLDARPCGAMERGARLNVAWSRTMFACPGESR